MVKRSYWKWSWLTLLFLAPVILWILPGDFFDNGKVILCLSRLFFNVECLGCGMTRAVMHFHHLQFSEAIYYNTGSLVVYPVLCFLWVQQVVRSWKGVAGRRKLEDGRPVTDDR